MRVTNNMIMENAANNINSTKELVNKRNTQMTTQKKISKPSDDPVVAVRSLRLSTTLSQVDQYYSKNIPDATSWLDVTETALINMRDIFSDCRELAVKGSTDTYNEDDRQTLINQLTSLQEQLYAEGNADYAGRTVFTGYRTDKNLTFVEDETETRYRIDQSFSVADSLTENRYYSGEVEVPTTSDQLLDETNVPEDITESDFYRIRLAYDDVDTINSIGFSFTTESTTAGVTTTVETSFSAALSKTDTSVYDSKTDQYTVVNGTILSMTGTAVTSTDEVGNTPTTDTVTDPAFNIAVYDDEDEWAKANGGTKEFPEDGSYNAVFIKSTGEIIFNDDASKYLMKNDATVDVQYDKTGFDDGELRPEYYYNCTKIVDPNDTECPVEYTKFDDDGNVINFDINYTVAADQNIVVNTEASNVFDSSLQRDLGEMINAVQATIDAHKKLDEIDKMLDEEQYASDECQEALKTWREAAKKEADYADDNMQKLFSSEIGNVDTYYAKINLAITDLGCKVDSLNLTKTRVGDQQETVQELQSENDDVDLSQIIIQYTAAYTAYQSSLQAAGKLSSNTLLNYI